MQCDDEQKYSAFSLFSCAYSWRILLSTTSMNVYVMGCSQCPALAAKYSSNLTSQPGLKANNVTVQHFACGTRYTVTSTFILLAAALVISVT